MSRIEVTLRPSGPVHDQATRLARARGETLWDMTERALRREIARIERFGPNAGLASPGVLQDLDHARTWPDLLARLRVRGLAARMDGAGITVFRLDDGARLDLPEHRADGRDLLLRLGPSVDDDILHWDQDRAVDPAVAGRVDRQA